MSDLNPMIEQALYVLKRQYGAPVDIYVQGTVVTDTKTGAHTIDKSVYPIDMAIVLPAKLSRNDKRGISLISANKNLVQGGFYDTTQRRFIIDRSDVPDLMLTENDWLVFKGRKYAFESIQEFEDDVAWVITAKAVIGEVPVPDQIFLATADNLLIFSDLASVIFGLQPHESIGDPLGFGDVASFNIDRSLSVSDALAFIDAATQNIVHSSSISQSLTFADVAANSEIHSQSVSDALAIVDAATQNIIHSSSVSSALALSDVASQTGPFHPTDIAGLQLWLKADSFSGADGDPVGTWLDSSGNSRDATAAGAQRPTYKTAIKNGLPIIRFSGTTWLVTPSFQTFPSKRGSLFVVFNNTGGSGYELMGIDDAGGHFWAAYTSATPFATKPKWNDGTAFNTAAYDTTTFTVQDWIRTGNTSLEYYKASSLLNTFAVGNTQQGGPSGVGIGTDPVNFNSNALHGDICEVLLYDTALSTLNRQLIENYLTLKWGL